MLWGLCLTKSVFRGVYGFKLPEIDFLLLRLCVLQSFHYIQLKRIPNSLLANIAPVTTLLLLAQAYRSVLSWCMVLPLLKVVVTVNTTFWPCA